MRVSNVLAGLAVLLIVLSIIGVLLLAKAADDHIPKKAEINRPSVLPDTGCVVVATINDCKIYHCTYKVPNKEQTYMVKELVVCQTSNACMVVVDRRRPP